MSRFKYPRLVTVALPNSRKKPVCALCNAPTANIRIEIQHDWFRGNDDVLLAHWGCLKAIEPDKRLDYVMEVLKNKRGSN